ncbi:MAG TPA: hypothetical protein VM925_37620 [Labilithrix sp.]|nr:hypothetical protein [Labilithrix sp.]
MRPVAMRFGLRRVLFVLRGLRRAQLGSVSGAILLVSVASACAGGSSDASRKDSVPSSAKNASDAGLAAKDADAGDEQLFAGSTAEATTLIGAAVDKKGAEIGMCVRDFRARKKLLRERVTVSFGIDQEGRLLGVTSKGKEDLELKGCVQDALKGARFPRSHAGVITVTKTYEEILQ